MPNFPLLDIAIAMIFVYLLLSLICSSLSEGFESLVRFRAKDLEDGIRALLSERRTHSGWQYLFRKFRKKEKDAVKDLTGALYRHPLIQSLQLHNHKPNYIPARNFALALMDLVKNSNDLIHNAMGGPAGPAPVQVQIGPATQPAAPQAPVTNLTIAQQIDNIPEPISIQAELRGTIDSLIVASNGDTTRIRENIEAWFNSTMDRASGWYKRRVQYILFTIAIAVTVAINADTITILSHLARTKNLQSIVSSATAFSSKGANVDAATAMSDLNSLDVGVGWIIPDAKNTSAAKGPRDFQNNNVEIRRAVPILVDGDILGFLSWCMALLWMHAFGWLITSAAIALGAPFWFDTLNRFIVVRSTVKPAEKSPTEKSKS